MKIKINKKTKKIIKKVLIKLNRRLLFILNQIRTNKRLLSIVIKSNKLYSALICKIKPIFYKVIIIFVILFKPVKKIIRSIYHLLPNRLKRPLKKIYRIIALIGSGFNFQPRKGRLSLPVIFKLAFKNLLNQPSRSIITITAMAIGIGAIVFLMSFGYGIQTVVNQRLIQPYSLRLSDVSSDSTALSLNKKTISEISNISGVEDVVAAVSLAGSLYVNNLQTDVVVIGASNRFLEYSHIIPMAGKVFSAAAENPYIATCQDGECGNIHDLLASVKEAEVKGESILKPKINIGAPITDIKMRFRIKDEIYLPLRQGPKINSQILGYVKGSVLTTYSGFQVWGGQYESVDTNGKYFQSGNGEWFGKWIKTEAFLYKEELSTIYAPITEENGEQIKAEGYLPQIQTSILSEKDVIAERQIEELLKNIETNKVLGEATASQNLITALTEDNSATSSVELELKEYVSKETTNIATQEAQLGIVEVAKKGGKEILISSRLLYALKLKPEQIVGKKVALEYIISGGVISGITGRVVSNKVNYKVVGVVRDDKQSLIFAPLADIESMGVDRYTQGKVLAANQTELRSVREKIESTGFVTRSIVDTLVQVNKLFGLMSFLLGSFGLIALTVAIIGMFNTLTITLLERTREIGVMKTLGTTDFDVVRLFIAESVIIGAVGGILGILLGVGLGEGLNGVLHLFQKDIKVSLFITPLNFVLIILLVALITGFFTGLYPAFRAKKISALDALRYE